MKLKACAIPVAMLGALVGDGAPSSLTDRGHSLASLYLPPAAVGSLPTTAAYMNVAHKYTMDCACLFRWVYSDYSLCVMQFARKRNRHGAMVTQKLEKVKGFLLFYSIFPKKCKIFPVGELDISNCNFLCKLPNSAAGFCAFCHIVIVFQICYY